MIWLLPACPPPHTPTRLNDGFCGSSHLSPLVPAYAVPSVWNVCFPSLCPTKVSFSFRLQILTSSKRPFCNPPDYMSCVPQSLVVPYSLQHTGYFCQPGWECLFSHVSVASTLLGPGTQNCSANSG